MKTNVVRSYAKINVCLDITGVREDGYHLLDMVMLPIELHDTMLIAETPKAVDNYITLDEFTVGDSQYNTVAKAIDFLNEVHPLGTKYKIDLHKVIPMKASEEQIHSIATRIGADVPFFIKCKPARCRGIGDQLDLINVKNDYHVLLVKPDAGCSTKEVYNLCDKKHNWPHGNVETVIKALEEGDDDLLAESIFNTLEMSSIEMVPEIQTIKDELKELGLKIVLMSGSGSSVFALNTDKKLIKKAAKVLEKKYTVIVTKVIK